MNALVREMLDYTRLDRTDELQKPQKRSICLRSCGRCSRNTRH